MMRQQEKNNGGVNVKRRGVVDRSRVPEWRNNLTLAAVAAFQHDFVILMMRRSLFDWRGLAQLQTAIITLFTSAKLEG